MARRENELFIGKEYLNIEGRTIKHPALIKVNASLNVNKLNNIPIELVGLDLETNAETGELKLLGFWSGKEICQYTTEFKYNLLRWVKYASNKKAHLAYWNRLDPFVLYKQLLLSLNDDAALKSLERFGKVSGMWDKKIGAWLDKPVIEIKMGDVYFGIKNVIRSSIQFFYRNNGSKYLNTVWAYDIAQLYESGLEAEALGKYDEKTKSYPNARLKYYSKVDESAHIVDWDRFNNDPEYKTVVLTSNGYDARAAADLGYLIQEDFKKAFGYYPTSLVSSGSLARAAIIATVFNKYNLRVRFETDPNYNDDEKKLHKLVMADLNSIPFINFKDEWVEKFGQDIFKEIYAITTEAYSGGQIESYIYGYLENAFTSDKTAAYPSTIQKLYDLRDAKLTRGTGEPPRIKNSYCYIRGTVDIPREVHIHPLTVKHPTAKETNIRPTGLFKASYLLQERDYLIKLGATFTDEVWFNIETTGKLSPLAEVSKIFSDLRSKFIKVGDSAQYITKKANNSMYGIQFEAVETYEDLKQDYSIANMTSIIDEIINDVVIDSSIVLNNKDVLAEQLVQSKKESNAMLSKHVMNYIVANGYIATNELTKGNITPLLKSLSKYIRKINLNSVKDELEFVLGDIKPIMARWHSPEGSSVEDAIEELKHNGIHIEYHDTSDAILKLDELYTSYKKSLKTDLIAISKAYSDDKLSDIKQSIYDSAFKTFNVNMSRVENVGYRAGEFFNPIWASVITAETRIHLCEAALEIEKNGGKVALMMTDSLFWSGSIDMLPQSYWTEVKTTGYFEKPKQVKEFLCLGSGRYEYVNEKDEYVSKKRGLNTTDYFDADGVKITDFSWHEAISNPKLLLPNNKVKVYVRSLVSVGMVLHNHNFTIKDLGRVIEEVREVDALVGINKRIPNVSNLSPKDLANGIVTTRPLTLGYGMFGNNAINDQTLPLLRDKFLKLDCKSAKQRKVELTRLRVKKHYDKNKDKINGKAKSNYMKLKEKGYSRDEARRMLNWSKEALNKALNN